MAAVWSYNPQLEKARRSIMDAIVTEIAHHQKGQICCWRIWCGSWSIPSCCSPEELRKLHDTLQHHLRSLKAMEQLDFERFMTALGDCKLDSLTIVDWQKSIQTEKDVPGHEKVLEFLDLRATATELTPQETSQRKPHFPFRKSSKFTPPENGIQNVSVYAANTQGKCAACSGKNAT